MLARPKRKKVRMVLSQQDAFSFSCESQGSNQKRFRIPGALPSTIRARVKNGTGQTRYSLAKN